MLCCGDGSVQKSVTQGSLWLWRLLHEVCGHIIIGMLLMFLVPG